MLSSDLTFYSLLVPSIMSSLGIITLGISHYKGLPSYLSSYAYALILFGLAILLNTVLSGSALIEISSLVAVLYFLSCAFHSKAIYERLNVDYFWPTYIYLISLGAFGIYYYTQVTVDQTARLLIIGIITAAIYLHRPMAFIQSTPRLQIDRYLKIMTFVTAFIAIGRAVLLTALIKDQGFVAHYAPAWALTQLLLLLIELIFLGVFISCAILDLVLRLQQERYRDPLTGLLNRRGLEAYIQKIDPNPKLQHAVLMADLDHFKSVNDRYGHQVGDLVLQHISQILKANIRSKDQVARIGGEEFLIVLPHIQKDATLKIAERIRLQLEDTPLQHEQQSIYLTISIGVYFFKDPAQIEDAIVAADQHLYQAKQMGRNQVQSA
ncbi:GGDEF domain-containing protein [Acinetobacter thermotolerans]|uniref:GGDEF domain-containing protein n=1 Tax=Acinetobacter thermotolerans TaxID=3151487 RepID=UPI00325BBA40